MVFKVNSTTMDTVRVNGTRMSVVRVNGTEVYRGENANLSIVATGTSATIPQSVTFNPGVEDVNRHFVIMSARFTAGGTTTGPVPTINGSAGTTILNDFDNGGSDGGRAGIFTFKIPTGTGTFTAANLDRSFCIFRVVGIKSMTTAYGTAKTIASGNFTVATPANGCAFVVDVANFNTITAITGTTTGLTYFPGNDNGAFGANNAVTSPTHTFQGYAQINLAASFAYDFF